MKPKIILVLLGLLLVLGALVLMAQEANIHIVGGQNQLKLAIPDFLGAGDAQKFMQVFNDTLWNEVDGGGVVKLVGKSLYPLIVPQRPDDFMPPAGRSKLTDWSDPGTVNANDLAFGYAASQGGQFVLIGNLYNLSVASPTQASLFANKRYTGSLDENGAREVARQYAADILAQFGGKSLSGTKIFFVSDRSAPARKLLDGTIITEKEIWWMDYDGSNQRQLTFYKSTSYMPTVSPDGKMFAFVSYPRKWVNGVPLDDNPQIFVHSVEPDRKLPFYSPKSSIVAMPEFTPDGKRMLLVTKLGAEKDPQIYSSNLQGGDLNPITHAAAVEAEPKVNPKTGSEVVFISGRTGLPQLWEMGIDGSSPHMLTDGTGEVSNPAWSPNGQFVAFSWTRGFTYGQFNIFIMNMATHEWDQLTHDTGDNENPTWAPDGLHLVYSSKRNRVSQIFSMLANGQHVKQLTTQGNNTQPVWTKGLN